MTQQSATGATAANDPSALAQDADWTADMVAQSGYHFHVRPAVPEDEALLADFFTHVDKEDLRFRFLTAVRTVAPNQLKALLTLDHQRTENFLAIDAETGVMIATAMLAAEETLASAEVAIAIRSDFKGRGVGWMMLDHVAQFATAKGIGALESVESRDNHQAIKLEQEKGWTASSVPDEPGLIKLRKTLQISAG
ncbi:GNAT family N-acetyltransferase [Sphingomonas radiodurans]|uniref:GNAT family N-acetyltransferase n=1 Tax=Sphingomonas radiodurans TaxID=2890321 RepID=UPI001E651826|nr:GNAT family N-acetyltransferase [Sphingomonas radiodurans]WBH17843.1 GNAT family N-acetyltransferase [Sphingomonas radiodurans]